jgi:hypothetical protein
MIIFTGPKYDLFIESRPSPLLEKGFDVVSTSNPTLLLGRIRAS